MTVARHCGRDYTLDEFRALDKHYVQRMTDGEEPSVLECVACPICGSHFGVWLDSAGNVWEDPDARPAD